MARITLREKYHDTFAALAKMSIAASKIDDTNVYQIANPETRKIMDLVVEENTTPDSYVNGVENFEEFYNQVQAGKHGLILMEHYSNTDLPEFIYMLEHNSEGKLTEFADKIVAVAGMKLNEADPAVRAFAESFSRVVIYPTRSLTKAEASAQSEEEIKEEEYLTYLRERKQKEREERAARDAKRAEEKETVLIAEARDREHQ